MKIRFLLLVFIPFLLCSQSNNNGQLDLITELSTIITVPFSMPDGVKLETDIYLPILSDSVTVELGGYTLEIIPKGTQLIVYDSIGDDINPNQYQLPLVFTRTPYSKTSGSEYGVYLNLLGYAYALQDMRGRYSSEGVYLPMYSDSWKKDVYHPNEKHILDVTNLSDANNGNFHEDGKNSITFIMDSLYKYYDLDGDGIAETQDKIYNGSIAMFGASALGNTQYQAASTIKNDVSEDGLKGLLPIVATNEYFNSVIQHNGVFREGLVGGWLTGQLNHNTNFDASDFEIQNSIHSLFDYGSILKDTAMKRGIDYAVGHKDENGFTGMYPNNLKRYDSDANFAMINTLGESDLNGTYNRYSNLELPMYHLTGWWDIFIDGQINTYKNIMNNTSDKTQKNQKLVIGPWTHGTIAQDTVSDLVFPPSVFDLKLIGVEALNGNFYELLDGELIHWFRYLLNYNSSKPIGEPKIMIPQSNKWQEVGVGDSIRIPAENFYISYSNFINFLGGFSNLDSVLVEMYNGTTDEYENIKISIPSITIFDFPNNEPVGNPVSIPVNFEEIPNIRYYVPGPIDDGEALNENVGNYWTSSETFPLTSKVSDYTLYFHNDGVLDTISPIAEPILSYIHNPENPVETVGGGNLTLTTPEGVNNTGPLDYSNPILAPLTMDRADVLKFETAFITDSLSIVGIPKAKIFASSNPLSGPNGATDTDFFIRIIDVYPNGKEIFVVEGAVNARAREYSKLLANNIEDVNTNYTNINSGEVYEYEFNLLPIAYTFGHNHKIKVLISSSNWPRYQCNANVPVEHGDFFRRKPNDGQTYSYNSVIYSPREARQDFYMTSDYKSQITLPLFDGIIQEYNPAIKVIEQENEWFIYPNPSEEIINIQLKNTNDIQSTVIIKDVLAKAILTKTFKNKITLNIKDITSGLYFVEIHTGKKVFSKKLIVK